MVVANGCDVKDLRCNRLFGNPKGANDREEVHSNAESSVSIKLKRCRWMMHREASEL